MPVAKFALRQVDLDKTSCFRRLLFAYFRGYEPKESKTEWIRTVLGKQMQKSDRMVGTIHFCRTSRSFSTKMVLLKWQNSFLRGISMADSKDCLFRLLYMEAIL